MAKPKTSIAKNKDIVSKSVKVNSKDNTGLPIELLEKLASYGIVPRVDFDHVEMHDTSSPRLNWLMGGGIPVSRVTTLSGKKKTGKTSLATVICSAELNANPNGLVFYFDTENKFSIKWAESLGVDLNRFIFCPIKTGEQLINSLPAILELENTIGVVIDSIRGTKWDAEANSDAEAQQMGVGAKMWAKFARKLSDTISNSHAWVLMLNGVYKTFEANSHEMIEPGGDSVPFMASLRLRTRPMVILDKEQGIQINLSCMQSQVGRNSGREASIVVNYINDKAIVNPLPEMSSLAKELDAIPMSGSWYHVGEKKWNGAPAFEQAMKEDEELFNYVYDQVMQKLNPSYEPPQHTYEELFNDPEEEPEDVGVPISLDEAYEIVGETLDFTKGDVKYFGKEDETDLARFDGES